MNILHQLHLAQQAADKLFSEAIGTDITPRQALIMVALADHPECSQTTLVKATGVDRSTLADVVARLIKKGWLARKRTKEDARAYAVSFTTEGRKALGSVRSAATKTERALLRRFPALGSLEERLQAAE